MAQASQPTAAPEPAPRPKKKLPLILAAVVLVHGAAGAVAFLASGGESAASSESEQGKPKTKPPPTEPGAIQLEPFILNLADPEGDRFLRATLRIVLDRAEAAEQVSADGLEVLRLRDRILRVLGTKTAESITTFEGKEELRAELRDALVPMIEDARVLDIFFTEFLVQ